MTRNIRKFEVTPFRKSKKTNITLVTQKEKVCVIPKGCQANKPLVRQVRQPLPIIKQQQQINHKVTKPSPPSFCISSASSVIKRSLLIGINYKHSENELSGCINDSEALKEFLTSHKFFSENDILMMNDNKTDKLYPSKDNIIGQLNELIKFAKANNTKQIVLFMAYSGHSNINSGYDALFPIDHERNGCIDSNELREKFIDKLPKNVKLILLVDSCNKSIVDLKYSYEADDKNTYTVIGKLAPTMADVIVISGVDIEDSLEENNGFILSSFIDSYKEGITYSNLIGGMRKWLDKKKCSQTPKLSSGRLIDIDKPFLLSHQ